MWDIHYKNPHGPKPLELAAGSHTLRQTVPNTHKETHDLKTWNCKHLHTHAQMSNGNSSTHIFTKWHEKFIKGITIGCCKQTLATKKTDNPWQRWNESVTLRVGGHYLAAHAIKIIWYFASVLWRYKQTWLQQGGLVFESVRIWAHDYMLMIALCNLCSAMTIKAILFYFILWWQLNLIEEILCTNCLHACVCAFL